MPKTLVVNASPFIYLAKAGYLELLKLEGTRIRGQNFGDLMVAGREPTQRNQFFLSMQTRNSKDFLSDIKPTRREGASAEGAP